MNSGICFKELSNSSDSYRIDSWPVDAGRILMAILGKTSWKTAIAIMEDLLRLSGQGENK